MVDSHGYDRGELEGLVVSRIGVDAARATSLVAEAVQAVGSLYPWSWRQVTEEIAVTAGDTETALPGDFEDLLGLPGYKANPYTIQRVVDPRTIRELRARSSMTGWPNTIAIEAVEHDPTAGQAWQILCWPTPASDFTMNVPILLRPKVLANDGDYPPGTINYHLAIAYWAMSIEEATAGGSDGLGGVLGPMAKKAQEYIQLEILSEQRRAAGVTIGRVQPRQPRQSRGKNDDLNMDNVTW